MITSTIEIHQMNYENIRAAAQYLQTFIKSDIVKKTGLSAATCSTIINKMLNKGEVHKVDSLSAGIGRPIDLFSYNGDFLHILTAYIYEENNGVAMEICTADAMGNVIQKIHKYFTNFAPEMLLNELEPFLSEDDLIKRVGISIPGIINGSIVEFCDIKAFEGMDFSEFVGKKFNVDVYVINDVKVVTAYLYRLLPEKPKNFAVMFYPDENHNGYIGAGFMINGHILRGATMFSGEMYHIAEAFGIGLNEQHQLMRNKDEFLKFVTKNLVAVCCTIDPSHAVIISSAIEESETETIRKMCGQFIDEKHIPTIDILKNSYEYASPGLIGQTLKHVHFPMTGSSAILP